MVAYSFQRLFVPSIEDGSKRQTIRGPRRRHARPGEPMQLYRGMRTKHCRKIVPDPVCVQVLPIRIDLRGLEGCFKGPKSEVEAQRLLECVTIDFAAERLTPAQCELLALADGFGGYSYPGSTEPMSALTHMVGFWINRHGPLLFEGVTIRWEPRL